LAVFWGVTVAVAVAATDQATRWVRAQAADQPALLVPGEEVHSANRDDVLRAIEARAEVGRARWLSPRELADRTTRSIGREDLWPELFAEGEAWLPWMAEVYFRDPLADVGSTARSVAALRGDARFRLVLWDGERLAAEADRLRSVRAVGFAAAAFFFLLGGAGVLATPSPKAAWGAQILIQGGAAVLLASVAALTARGAGLPLEARTVALGLATAFTLAGVFAPVLKMRPSSSGTSGS